jgi:hypothetical protein
MSRVKNFYKKFRLIQLMPYLWGTHLLECLEWIREARFFTVQNAKTEINIPKDHKIYQIAIPKLHQMSIMYTKWPKIYRHSPFQGPPKYAQVGIVGMKKYHLATLNRIDHRKVQTERRPRCSRKASTVQDRVARWSIFKPKIPIWVNFRGSCNGRCWYVCVNLVYFTATW